MCLDECPLNLCDLILLSRAKVPQLYPVSRRDPTYICYLMVMQGSNSKSMKRRDILTCCPFIAKASIGWLG